MRLARATVLAAALLLAVAPLRAQWPQTVPREVDVDAPAPRTADGRIDLSGVWRGGGPSSGPGGFSYPGPDVYEPRGVSVLPSAGVPRTDYGDQLFKQRQATFGRDNPRGLCLPVGLMQLHTTAAPARYVQTPDLLVILYEGNNERREIYTDGRALPAGDVQPWWNGYSVGRWDEDVLVVETTHFRDGVWLDGMGNPLTDAARITERFRRPSYGRMEVDITVDDPEAYLRPIRIRFNQVLIPGTELIESVCNENNKFPPPPDRGNAK